MVLSTCKRCGDRYWQSRLPTCEDTENLCEACTETEGMPLYEGDDEEE